ncbi:hypothetical protein DM01DRAFT_1334795 [Hesseltinella vesiculosa]|uniref:Matrin-type domain-containing protein n=1 Tax=Hesseltinella vesiculosa TaxID=101127 RepID=A0A1X2GLB7_9FUNG|nr:hypothetical protein DM01DRAFT_1334795 [Hesseltinella vesiculosa]
MDSVLEEQRLSHELIERLEEACVQEFLSDPKTHRDRLKLEQSVDGYLTRLNKQSSRLAELYQDESRTNEIETISKPSLNLDAFYQQLTAINGHHDKYPNQQIDAPEFEFLHFAADDDQHDEVDDADEKFEHMFSGEEHYGRYLDLNALHGEYVNLKNVNRVEYIPYLDRLDKFESDQVYPAALKTTEAYRQYLDHLHDYLVSFLQRARPLVDLQSINDTANDDFEKTYKPSTSSATHTTNGHATNAPAAALYCQACQKDFAKQTVYDAHLKGKKHIKAQTKLDQEGADDRVDKRKALALKEALILAYLDVLKDTRQQTKANVERKQALTDRERTLEQEQNDIEIAEDSDNDSDEERIYNPLKLPLGWDGKPIPYWLYKLHGLGVEYPCEICGNYVYMGRKAFDKHFQEARHVYGMRCLGLTNSRQFHEITKIADAYALNEKLKKQNVSSQVKDDNVEEYEDEEGNVFNKKIYEDLKRQGLL